MRRLKDAKDFIWSLLREKPDTFPPSSHQHLAADITDLSTIKGERGEKGNDGQSATITVRNTITAEPGTAAQASNVGTPLNAILDFIIPRGKDGTNGKDGKDGASIKGDRGEGATVRINSVTTLPAGQDATVLNVGTDTSALLNIGIPRGLDGTNGSNGTNGVNGKDGKDGKDGINGTNGVNGTAATIAIDSVVTLPAGSAAAAENVGTPQAAKLKIGIPRGTDGVNGTNGTNGTSGTNGKDGVSIKGDKGDPGIIYQNGTNAPSIAKIWTGKATTDANGDAAFTFPAGYFATVHAANPAVERVTTNIAQAPSCSLRTALTTSGVTVRVVESKTTGVLILNTMVEGLEPAPAGVTVYLTVYGS